MISVTPPIPVGELESEHIEPVAASAASVIPVTPIPVGELEPFTGPFDLDDA